MSDFNKGDFKRFLESDAASGGDRLRRSVPPSQSIAAKTFLKKTLTEHDRIYHRNGYKPGDKCNFRAAMVKNDMVDDLVAEKPDSELKIGMVKFRESPSGKREIVDVVEIEEATEELEEAAAEDSALRYLDAVATERKG